MGLLSSHHDQRRARRSNDPVGRLRAISLHRANGQAIVAGVVLVAVGLWQLVADPERAARLLRRGGSWWD